ncbi:MAG: hypothetical protein ACE5JL_06815 [Dehalococcoidia bacterium]
MLFLSYFELNENMPDEERLQIGQKLTSSGGFPPKGVKIIRWDATPDAWGILVMEAEKAEDVFRAIDMWRAAGTGFFKSTKTSPAIPIQELMPIAADLLKTMAST